MRSWEAECLPQAFVEKAGYGHAHERTRGPWKPACEHVARHQADRAPRLGAAEAGGLVAAVELLECRQVLGMSRICMRLPTSRQKPNQPHRSSTVSARQPKRSSQRSGSNVKVDST